MKKHLPILIALLAITMLVLAACGGGAAEPTAAPEPTEAPAAAPTEAPVAEPTEAPAVEEPAMESTGLEYLDKAYAGEFDGSVVTLLGVMVEEDGQKMELALEPFIEATGIDVQYTGTKEFETQINIRSMLAIHLTSPTSPNLVFWLPSPVRARSLMSANSSLSNICRQLRPGLAGYGYHAWSRWR